MEYPGSSFNKTKRKILLTVFIICFFITSPLIIAHTTGYRYDWREGLIKETGAISIEVLPKNADVYINNQKIKDRMPLRLSNITPNKYNLRITAENYYDWYKEIEVKNKQTVYIKEIELIRKNKPELIDSNETIKVLSLSPNGQYIIYQTQNKNNSNILLKNNLTGTKTSFLTLPITEKVEANWAPQSSFFILRSEFSPYSRFLLYSTNNLKNAISILNTDEKIIKFQWAEGETNPRFYFSTAENLYTFNPLNEQKDLLSNISFIDWQFYFDKLWVLDKNTTTNQIKIIKNFLNSPNFFSYLDNDTRDSASSTNEWKILTINQNSVLVTKNPQNEMTLVTQNKKFNLSATNFLISPYNSWWLLWNPWELSSYTEGENPALLNRSGEQLKQVIPLDLHNTLLLVWAEKTTIFFPYYQVHHDFVDTSFSTVGVDTSKKIIYFTGEFSGKKGLWKLIY